MTMHMRRFSVQDLTRDALKFSIRFGTAQTHVFPAATNGEALIEGQLLAREVSPGLLATGHDITYLQDRNMPVEVCASLTLGVLLDGETHPMRVPGHQPLEQSVHSAILIGFGSKTECVADWRLRQKCMMAGFSIRRHFFDRFADAVEDDALSALRRFFDLDYKATILPTSPALSRMAAANLSHTYSGVMEELFLESNTLSLLIEASRLLSQGDRQEQRISARHRKLLQAACERIDADLACPPATIALAREIGTNVTTLQGIFRQALGTTILGYVQYRRLDVARLMIQERVASVGEIGSRVGYSSPAAFTAAYRRRFGHPPSQE